MNLKLTPSMLRRIIEEEVGKFGEMEDVEKRAKDTDETEADELSDSLAKKIDYAKALKVEEGRLTRRLVKIKEQRKHVLSTILKVV